MVHSVALIGLGRIGMLYDIELPESGYVLSHARAFALHPEFELVSAVDPVAANRERFTERYKVPAFPSVFELLSHCSPDVVVVASPTHTHLTIIEEVVRYSHPKAILCEKPLAYSSGDAEAIVQRCYDMGVKLFVNYFRRADPAVTEVKARIECGRIASPFKTVVWYSKGLLHNGSHFLDLLTFWFGPPMALKIIDAGRDVGEHDAEPDFWVEFANGTAIFCSAKEENYSHYTVEIVSSNGRLRYEQGGRTVWQAAGAHPTLEKYRQLQKPEEEVKNDMNRYQYHVVEQLSLALRKTPHTLCTGDSGLTYIQSLETLLKERERSKEKWKS